MNSACSYLGKKEAVERAKPMNVKKVIEKIKTEIKRVKEKRNTHSIFSAWDRSDLSWCVTAAHLIGELNGLRFALDLLKGKGDER